MRKLLIASLLTAIGLSAILATAGGAGAQNDPVSPDPGQVTVIQISGLLDDVLADFITDAIDGAEGRGDLALVLQVNSRDAVIEDDALRVLAARITGSSVPVVSWIGPSGSVAAGKVAQLVGITEKVGVSPGSKLGDLGDIVLTPTLWSDDNTARMTSQTLNWVQVLDSGVVPCEQIAVDELGRSVSEEDQLVRCASPLVGDFLVDLDEFGFQSRQVTEGDQIRLAPVTGSRFQSIGLMSQLMHTVASPPVAYLLLTIGISLLLFELYSVGAGIAGWLGGVLVGLGGYGVAALPFHAWALVLLVLAFVLYAADVQTGVPSLMTLVATVALTVGTFGLWDGVSMSWVPMLVGIVGVFLMMWLAMPLMIRGRYGTPRIDRDTFVGEPATWNGDATIEMRGATWQASTGQSLDDGAAVTITAIDNLVFTVEPASNS